MALVRTWQCDSCGKQSDQAHPPGWHVEAQEVADTPGVITRRATKHTWWFCSHTCFEVHVVALH